MSSGSSDAVSGPDPPSSPSTSSGANSAFGPNPAAQTVVEFMNLTPKEAKTFSGRRDTITFADWYTHTEAWMDALDIPEGVRTRVAILRLEGPALVFWTGWAAEFGQGSWENFGTLLHEQFEYEDVNTWLNNRVKTFKQTIEETVQLYTYRFQDMIVNTCPRPVNDLAFRRIYWSGLNRASRPLEAFSQFRTLAELQHQAIQLEIRLSQGPRVVLYDPVPGALVPAGPFDQAAAEGDPVGEDPEEEDPEEDGEP